MTDYKYPKYIYLYHWGEELDIETWRVNSMIERVGGNRNKLKRQKKYPWLYKKGRRKYRIFIARWMEYWGLISEADYVRNWKSKEDWDKQIIEEIPGWNIYPTDEYYFSKHWALIPLRDANKYNRDDPTPLIIQQLADLISRFFIHKGLELPKPGGWMELSDKSYNTILEFGNKLIENGVNFPYYDKQNVYGEYVYYEKDWSDEEWISFVTTAVDAYKWKQKKEFLWVDYNKYLSCPWTNDQLEDWMNQELSKTNDKEEVNKINHLYSVGFHVIHYWRIKYCKPENNDLANWIKQNRVDFGKQVKPYELWNGFKSYISTYKWLDTRWWGAVHIDFGTREIDRIIRQYEIYNFELGKRSPLHPLFYNGYKKYRKTGAEYTEFGDVSPVTNIPTDQDQLSEFSGVKTFRNTEDMEAEIQRLSKHLPPNYKSVKFNW